MFAWRTSAKVFTSPNRPNKLRNHNDKHQIWNTHPYTKEMDYHMWLGDGGVQLEHGTLVVFNKRPDKAKIVEELPYQIWGTRNWGTANQRQQI